MATDFDAPERVTGLGVGQNFIRFFSDKWTFWPQLLTDNPARTPVPSFLKISWRISPPVFALILVPITFHLFKKARICPALGFSAIVRNCRGPSVSVKVLLAAIDQVGGLPSSYWTVER